MGAGQSHGDVMDYLSMRPPVALSLLRPRTVAWIKPTLQYTRNHDVVKCVSIADSKKARGLCGLLQGRSNI